MSTTGIYTGIYVIDYEINRVREKLIRAKFARRKPCHSTCPGWAVFDESNLQRCDECWQGVEDPLTDGEVALLPEAAAALEAPEPTLVDIAPPCGADDGAIPPVPLGTARRAEAAVHAKLRELGAVDLDTSEARRDMTCAIAIALGEPEA